MATPSTPHLIYGIIYSFSGTAGDTIPLLITNSRTGDTQTTTSNEFGQYVIDCGNFTNGYENNDTLSIEYNPAFAISDFELFVSINNGGTWSQTDNATSVATRYNRGRIKINTTHYPGGRTDLTVETGS